MQCWPPAGACGKGCKACSWSSICYLAKTPTSEDVHASMQLLVAVPLAAVRQLLVALSDSTARPRPPFTTTGCRLNILEPLVAPHNTC